MKNENFKIPFVLGVTGHRDIEQGCLEGIKDRLREIYDFVTKEYADTPIILLSPLADGADRIAVEVAQEDKYRDKIAVSVPLPFDVETYKATFAKGMLNYKKASDERKEALEKESIHEFDTLFQKVKEQKNEYLPKSIPMPFDKSLYETSPNENQRTLRRKQYSYVGEYIALYSNVLIAIYDNQSEEKSGGSKEIVRKKLTGDYEYVSELKDEVTYPEEGVVYSISIHRSNVDASFTDCQVKVLFPDGKEIDGLRVCEEKKVWKQYVSTVKDYFSKPCVATNVKKSCDQFSLNSKQINCFNKNVDKHITAIKKRYESERLEEVDIDKRFLNKNLMIKRSASELSAFYQKKMQILEKYISLFIAVITFLLLFKEYSNFEYASYASGAYIWIIVVFTILYQKFKGYKEKHEDYRSLAESMRVQIAWNIAQINDSVSLYYLSHQQNEIGWIRTAVRGIRIFYLPKNNELKIDDKMLYHDWIRSQIKYFVKGIKKYDEKEKRVSQKIKIFFAVSIIFMGLFGVMSYFSLDHYKDMVKIANFNLEDILKVMLITIPLTITTYLKSKQIFDGNKEILKEYRLSLDIFCRARKLLLEKKNCNGQRIYKNLGIEALRENSSWIITRRTKEYNTPS